jgi:17beta-estradiol 17-dehydrogenase / very-long-chain 3-oxoacyl-CoA reductase
VTPSPSKYFLTAILNNDNLIPISQQPPSLTMAIFNSIFTIIGMIASLLLTYRIINFIALYTRPSQISRYAHASADGKPAWALVTGSAAGIGLEFARQLADHGFNVIIHGRHASRLESVRAALQASHPGREFRILVADASTAFEAKQIKFLTEGIPGPKELGQLNVTVVINNVGGGDTGFTALHAADPKSLVAQTSVNALFGMLLLRGLLPQMIARSTPALVINMGSMADQGLPLLSVYAGAKAFTMLMSKAMAREMVLEGHDVEIMHLRSGVVRGTDTVKGKPDFFNPDPRTFVKAALARVGCGRSVVIPYIGHALQIAVVEMVPGWMRERGLISLMRDLRENWDKMNGPKVE